MIVSASKAAKLTNMTTPAITKACKDGRLSHEKQGQAYLIDTSELFRVYPKVNSDKGGIVKGNDNGDIPPLNSGLMVELEVLRKVTEIDKDRIEEISKDRDKWQEQAERLSITKANQNEQNAPEPQNQNINILTFLIFGAVLALSLIAFKLYQTI